MTNVFLSYRSTDHVHAARIAENLVEEGITPWWDRLSTSGALDAVIREKLDLASVILVLCRPNFASSPWVNGEIEYGARSRKAIPVLIADMADKDLPISLQGMIIIRLQNWDGSRADPNWRKLVAYIQCVLTGLPPGDIQPSDVFSSEPNHTLSSNRTVGVFVDGEVNGDVEGEAESDSSASAGTRIGVEVRGPVTGKVSGAVRNKSR